MRRYVIHDEDERYEVEEFEHEDVVDETSEEIAQFTDDEIIALKKLLPHIDKIVEIVSKSTETTDEELEEEAETDYVDEDEDIDEVEDAEEEKVIESEKLEKRPYAKDSKSSFGAIEYKKKSNKSIADSDDINEAWNKRYGGNK